MNRSAVLVMFVLLLIAGGVAFYMRSRQETETRPKSPLESIDYSSVVSISAQREDLPRWTLERHGSNLLLSSEAVAAGSAVAGNPELRGKILGFLQDASYIEHRALAGFDLAEWGLEPPLISVDVVDSSGGHGFEVGRADMNGDVWLRARDGAWVFKYPSRVVSDLGLEARWYRDARLADIPAHLADEFVIEPIDGPTYRLRRVGIRWQVQIDGGRSFRADPAFADQMTVALTNLIGEPAPAGIVAEDAPARFKVTIRGQGRECRYDVVSADERGILARRADEPDLRRVDRMLARFFVADPTTMEDDRLIGIDPSEITGILIGGSDRPELYIQRSGEFWRILFGNLLVRPVDPESFRGLREALEGMKSRGSSAAPADFAARNRLKIEFDRDLAIPALVIEFSAPDAQGLRLARRSDQPGVLTVGPEVEPLLGLRYWNVMVRYFTAGEAEKVDHLGIRDPEGRQYRLVRDQKDGNWDLVDVSENGSTIAGFTPKVIPGEPLARLVDRLAQLSVAGFLGERSDDDLARIFAAPRYVVSWSSPEMLIVPPVDARAPRATEKKSWEIGARLDDDHLQSRMSNFPALVFPVSGDELLPITDALRALGN